LNQRKNGKLSLNRVFKALIELGLSQTDARVYIYLATKGSKSANEICDALKANKQIIYPSLKNLRNNRIITVNSKRPLIFSAVPFEEVLDMLIKKKFEQSEEILETKKELVKSWTSVDWNNNK
jgi:sugar-specific transcriptional regulator TrmB